MTGLAIVLSMVLATPIGPQLNQQNDVGEVSVQPTFDRRFSPPSSKAKTGAKLLLVLGLGIMAAGLVGLMSASGCRTRDETRRCIDPGQSNDAYPALLVIGFGMSISAGAWHRQY